MQANTSALQQLLSQLLKANFPLHLVIEQEVQLTPFGEITVNVVIRDGVADFTTLNIVKRRRKRYNRIDKPQEE